MKIKYENNPEILNNFLYYLSGIKNYSVLTIEQYCLDLMMFFNFLKNYWNLEIEVKDFNIFILANVKEADVIAFLVYLNFNRDNTAPTRQRKLSVIRRFYKWLFANYPSCYAKENPTQNIYNIPRLVRIPKYLSLEKAKKIQNVFTPKNSKYPVRNNTIINLFLNTGIRLSELANINLSDINLNNNFIIINRGKGNKERVAYLNKSAKKQLLKYLKIRNRNKKIIDINEALFISYQNDRMGIASIENVCKQAYKLAGLEDCGYTTHTLRHTAATLMYMYGNVDIVMLKEFLGHVNVSTTEIYTHVENKQVRAAVNNNPLNEIPVAA